MGIGSVTSWNNMSGMQMTMAGSTDTKSKNIQNEIKNVQQQMQNLSSKEELSVNEKAKERKKLQKEISSLNTELKQHQEEFRRSQKREIMMAELQEEKEPVKGEDVKVKPQTKETASDRADEKDLSTVKQQADRQETVIIKNNDGIVTLKGSLSQDENFGIDTDKKQAGETSLNKADETKEGVPAKKETKTIDNDMDTNTGLSHKEIHAIVSADASVQRAGRQETVIARIRGGIAILKSEITQDETHDTNTDKKQAELEKLEKKEERARAFQFSVLGEANNTMRSAAKANVSGTKDTTQVNTENNAFINASRLSKEEDRTLQQKFYVSLGN